MAIRVLLATGDLDTSERMLQVLAEAEQVVLAPVARDFSQVQGLLASDPELEVLVVDEHLEGRGFELARLIAGANPLLGVIMLVDHPGPAQAAASMEVGARSVIGRAASLAEIVSRLEAVAQWVGAARATVGQDTVGKAGRVIAVAGAKGGVGTTVLALLLARGLVGTRSVGLVDFDLQSGDLAAYLGVNTRRSVVDLVEVATDMPGRVLRETSYEVAGMRLLSAPKNGEREEEMTVRAARAAIGALRFQFDVSVVDVGSHLTEPTAAVLEEADVAVLVVTPDLPALRAARRTFAMWERLAVRAPTNLTVVLNRSHRGREVTQQIAGKILETPVAISVPEGGAEFESSMNAASVVSTPGPVHAAMAELGRRLMAVSHVEAPVEQAVAEIDAGRRARRRRVKLGADGGQSVVELPMTVLGAALVALLAAQGIVAGAGQLIAREAAYEAARTYALTHDAHSATDEAHDQIAGFFDHDTQVSISASQVTVDLRTPGLLPAFSMRAAATVPVSGR